MFSRIFIKALGCICIGIIFYYADMQSILADENRWSTNGPYDGGVHSIAIHPFDNSHIYIGSGCLWQSTNGGAWWFPMTGDSSFLPMVVLKIHPFGPDTMMAGTVQGLYKSTNGGASWFLLNTPQGMYDIYRDVEFHPGNPSIVFATGQQTCRSTDGGRTWTALPIPANPSTALEFDPTRPNRLYVTTLQSWEGAAVLYSDDLGDTWHNISGDLDSTSTVQDIAVDPTDDRIIYVVRLRWFGDDNRIICKTTDGGLHWTSVSPPGISWHWATCVKISPFDHNTVFLSTIADGVFRSRNGGQTWQQINNGLMYPMGNTLTIDSTTGIIYYGTIYNGIYRSADEGDSWVKISDGLTGATCRGMIMNPRDPDSLALATEVGLYTSDDGALSWHFREIESFDPFLEMRAIACDPLDSITIYIAFTYYGSQAGIYRSTDGGNNWQKIQGGLPGLTLFGKFSTTIRNGISRLYLGSAGGLYFSDDRGESWQRCPNLPGDGHGVPLASKTNPDIVYVSGGDGELFKSTDAGSNWELLACPPGAEWVNEMHFDPVDSDILYAAFWQAGLFKSTDGGQSWLDINGDLPRIESYEVMGIAINPLNNSEIYAVSNGCGAYVTYNGGQSWERFSEGFWTDNLLPVSTIIVPQDTSRIFMALYGFSVWSITRTPLGVNDHPPQIPLVFSLSQNYPNPFNPTTTIAFNLPARADVVLELFNILGQRVMTLPQGVLSAGGHSLAINTGDLGSGVYFYKLAAGDKTSAKKMVILK